MKFERSPDDGRFYALGTHEDVTDFLTEFFRIRAAKQKGGRSKSAKKRKAAIANGRKHTGKPNQQDT